MTREKNKRRFCRNIKIQAATINWFFTIMENFLFSIEPPFIACVCIGTWLVAVIRKFIERHLYALFTWHLKEIIQTSNSVAKTAITMPTFTFKKKMCRTDFFPFYSDFNILKFFFGPKVQRCTTPFIKLIRLYTQLLNTISDLTHRLWSKDRHKMESGHVNICECVCVYICVLFCILSALRQTTHSSNSKSYL